MTHTYTRILAAAIIGLALLTGPAAAQTTTTTTPGDEDDSTGSALDSVIATLQELVSELEDFTGDWNNVLKETLIAVFFAPFRTLAQTLLEIVTKVLTTAPQVHPNPAVEEVHRQTLIVTYLLAVLGFVATGILYIIGPILNVSYRDARLILPRLVTALLFATLSLPLLQLGIDLSNALATAFAPTGLYMSFQELAGLSTGLVIVWFTESLLLLAVVVLFLIRDVYLLFGAAVSPLLALMWSMPRAKRYADTFIAGWFAALMIGPADVLVLKFALALMQGAGEGPLQSVSNWLFGVTALTLLLLVPFQIWGASQTIVGRAYSVAGSVGSSGSNSEDLGLSPEEKDRLRKRKKSRNSGGTGKYQDLRDKLQ